MLNKNDGINTFWEGQLREMPYPQINRIRKAFGAADQIDLIKRLTRATVLFLEDGESVSSAIAQVKKDDSVRDNARIDFTAENV